MRHRNLQEGAEAMMLMMTLGACGGCGQPMRQRAESLGPTELVLRGANIPGLAAPGTARTIVISQGLISAFESDAGFSGYLQ